MKYRDDYIALHNKGTFFFGYSLLDSKHRIYKLIKDTKSETLLDYGSGKGWQYSKRKMDLYWGVEVDCYDPGYEPFSQLPNKTYDGVVCTEVMEHIPENEIDQALTEIFERANKFVFFTIARDLSNSDNGKTLLDGSNLHVTIKSAQWWKEKIDTYTKKSDLVVVISFGNKIYKG